MSTNWKPLEEDLRLNWDKGRMGGALLGVTIITGSIAVVSLLSLVILLGRLAWIGPAGVRDAVQALLSNPVQSASLIFMIPAFVFTLWSIVVFVMTLARARATPTVASVGMAFYFLIAVTVPIVGQARLLAAHGAEVGAQLAVIVATMIPAWTAELALIVAFAGYMLGGVRPNAYFRNRVAVPDVTSSPRRAP